MGDRFLSFPAWQDGIFGVIYVMNSSKENEKCDRLSNISQEVMSVLKNLVEFVQIVPLILTSHTIFSCEGSVVDCAIDVVSSPFKVASTGSVWQYYFVAFLLVGLMALAAVSVGLVFASSRRRDFQQIWPLIVLRTFAGIILITFFNDVVGILLVSFSCPVLRSRTSLDYECWNSLHIATCVLAVFCLIFIIPFGILVALIFDKFEPTRKSAGVQAHGRIEIFFILYKVYCSVQYVLVLTNHSLELPFHIATVLLTLFVVVIHILQAPFFHEVDNRLRTAIMSSLLGLSITRLCYTAMHWELDDHSYLLMSGIIGAFVGWNVAMIRKKKLEFLMEMKYNQATGDATSTMCEALKGLLRTPEFSSFRSSSSTQPNRTLTLSKRKSSPLPSSASLPPLDLARQRVYRYMNSEAFFLIRKNLMFETDVELVVRYLSEQWGSFSLQQCVVGELVLCELFASLFRLSECSPFVYAWFALIARHLFDDLKTCVDFLSTAFNNTKALDVRYLCYMLQKEIDDIKAIASLNGVSANGGGGVGGGGGGNKSSKKASLVEIAIFRKWRQMAITNFDVARDGLRTVLKTLIRENQHSGMGTLSRTTTGAGEETDKEAGEKVREESETRERKTSRDTGKGELRRRDTGQGERGRSEEAEKRLQGKNAESVALVETEKKEEKPKHLKNLAYKRNVLEKSLTALYTTEHALSTLLLRFPSSQEAVNLDSTFVDGFFKEEAASNNKQIKLLGDIDTSKSSSIANEGNHNNSSSENMNFSTTRNYPPHVSEVDEASRAVARSLFSLRISLAVSVLLVSLVSLIAVILHYKELSTMTDSIGHHFLISEQAISHSVTCMNNVGYRLSSRAEAARTYPSILNSMASLVQATSGQFNFLEFDLPSLENACRSILSLAPIIIACGGRNELGDGHFLYLQANPSTGILETVSTLLPPPAALGDDWWQKVRSSFLKKQRSVAQNVSVFPMRSSFFDEIATVGVRPFSLAVVTPDYRYLGTLLLVTFGDEGIDKYLSDWVNVSQIRSKVYAELQRHAEDTGDEFTLALFRQEGRYQYIEFSPLGTPSILNVSGTYEVLHSSTSVANALAAAATYNMTNYMSTTYAQVILENCANTGRSFFFGAPLANYQFITDKNNDAEVVMVLLMIVAIILLILGGFFTIRTVRNRIPHFDRDDDCSLPLDVLQSSKLVYLQEMLTQLNSAKKLEDESIEVDEIIEMASRNSQHNNSKRRSKILMSLVSRKSDTNADDKESTEESAPENHTPKEEHSSLSNFQEETKEKKNKEEIFLDAWREMRRNSVNSGTGSFLNQQPLPLRKRRESSTLLDTMRRHSLVINKEGYPVEEYHTVPSPLYPPPVQGSSLEESSSLLAPLGAMPRTPSPVTLPMPAHSRPRPYDPHPLDSVQSDSERERSEEFEAEARLIQDESSLSEETPLPSRIRKFSSEQIHQQQFNIHSSQERSPPFPSPSSPPPPSRLSSVFSALSSFLSLLYDTLHKILLGMIKRRISRWIILFLLILLASLITLLVNSISYISSFDKGLHDIYVLSEAEFALGELVRSSFDLLTLHSTHYLIIDNATRVKNFDTALSKLETLRDYLVTPFSYNNPSESIIPTSRRTPERQDIIFTRHCLIIAPNVRDTVLDYQNTAKCDYFFALFDRLNYAILLAKTNKAEWFAYSDAYNADVPLTTSTPVSLWRLINFVKTELHADLVMLHKSYIGELEMQIERTKSAEILALIFVIALSLVGILFLEAVLRRVRLDLRNLMILCRFFSSKNVAENTVVQSFVCGTTGESDDILTEENFAEEETHEDHLKDLSATDIEKLKLHMMSLLAANNSPPK